MRHQAAVVYIVITLTSILSAQAPPPPSGLATRQQSGVMTNADIVKLAQAGLGDAITVQTISRAEQTKFDTSTDELIRLKVSGVSDAVIAAMLSSKSAGTLPTVSTPSTTSVASRTPLGSFKGGVLDEIVLYVDHTTSTHVVMRPFSASDADIVKGEKKEETKTMQSDGPRMLAERFAAKLKELGPFKDVTVLDKDAPVPDDAMVVEGKFTELDPGSRAKRYVVGFGAGKSAITVDGFVKSADGTVLATFQQRRIGVMGMYGGDSLGKLVSDTKNLGEDLAKFMNAWATGKKLK